MNIYITPGSKIPDGPLPAAFASLPEQAEKISCLSDNAQNGNILRRPHRSPPCNAPENDELLRDRFQDSFIREGLTLAIQRFSISNDPALYEAWPDVVLTNSGKLVCVFSECSHHGDRSYTRIMSCISTDRGRTWSPKTPITEGTAGLPYFYNCPRIRKLSDGRLVLTIDRLKTLETEDDPNGANVMLYFSADEGESWSEGMATPLHGIVPDKVLELPSGRLIIAAHHRADGKLAQFLHYSDDGGKSWSNRITVAKSPDFNLCEGNMLYCGDNTIVTFMRENSGLGFDCKKTISHDGGESWGPIIDLPLPGCHRPTAGFLHDGRVMITYRFLQGGQHGWGNVTQNFFAAVIDPDSVLAEQRCYSHARIMPIDYDRSPYADLGYSGWVQFPDGEIYIVQYIVDDAWDKGQIRGYALQPGDFMLEQKLGK